MIRKLMTSLSSPSKVSLILYIVLFRFMLDYIYCNIVSPMYQYTGLITVYSLTYYVISWLMLFIYILLLLSIINIQKNGAVVLSIIFISSAIPTTTIVAFLEHNLEFAISNIFYWCFAVLFYKKKSRKISISTIKTVKRTSAAIYFIFLFFAAILLLICYKYTGVHITFNLYDVYATRTNFKSTSFPTILQYLFSACIIVFPIIIVYGLNKRKKGLTALSIACQLLAFGVDGRKSTLFVLISTILGYYFVHKITAKLVPSLVLVATSLGLAEKIVFGTDVLINLVIRRLFLIPAYLQYAYFDFFYNNPKDFFRQSFLRRLGFTSPYTIDIPTLIGSRYYLNSYANNGLFADAYSNLGVLGIIVLPFLIAAALKFLDTVSEGLSGGICIGIILVSSYTLLSSSFFTVMLTHGFLLGCIIIYFIPRFEYRFNDSKQIEAKSCEN